MEGRGQGTEACMLQGLHPKTKVIHKEPRPFAFQKTRLICTETQQPYGPSTLGLHNNAPFHCWHPLDDKSEQDR
ncbi:hypothetical protein UPYG_G00077830 [Umbra pygmaea]|uniref:Uncharacterized protein n=1 Tax=Umbra pygmaea TaxID=75934 RepID=A0ABD0XD32_UMBPY